MASAFVAVLIDCDRSGSRELLGACNGSVDEPVSAGYYRALAALVCGQLMTVVGRDGGSRGRPAMVFGLHKCVIFAFAAGVG